jgi:hypothetical protein
MNAMKFKWKAGSRIKRINPQKAGERLEQIRRRNRGRLEPEGVVADARPKSSPLHVIFEWDDTAAAAQYRIVQARLLIRSIEVVRIESIDCPQNTRAFVSILQRGDEMRSYISTRDAMYDVEYRAQVLEDAKAELIRFKQKYAGLIELAEVIAAIDKVAA